LGTATLDGRELKLIQNGNSEPSLALHIGDSNLVLQIQPKPESKGLRSDAPLQAKSIALPDGASGASVTFTLDDGEGGARSVLLLLFRSGEKEKWALAREWVAESAALGELGFKRESQELETKDGQVIRHFKSLAVEGLAHKMDCGCVACQSRTTEITEDETLTWSSEKHSFETTLRQKWYTAQPNENLMAIARKALGDARLMQLIIKLNPQLKDAPPLKGGEKILVEREEKKK
jgi:hypothetical protein